MLIIRRLMRSMGKASYLIKINAKHLYRIAIFITVFHPSQLFGQEAEAFPKTRTIGLQLGAQSFLLNDEIGSNLNYSGSAFAAALTYQASENKKRQAISLRYASPTITNDFNSSQIEGLLVMVDYSFQKKVTHFSSIQSDLYLGPYVRFQGFDRTFNFDRNTGSKDTGEVFGSVGLSTSLAKNFGAKNRFDASVGIPVLSYIFSREFTGSFTNEFLWVNRLVDYRFQLDYQRKLQGNWSFQAGYGFNYYHADRTNDVNYGSHLFLVGFLMNI
ncbi:MAG: hypothetical protein ACR2MX_18735 [Cyclobacteriaceae bacterium]